MNLSSVFCYIDGKSEGRAALAYKIEKILKSSASMEYKLYRIEKATRKVIREYEKGN